MSETLVTIILIVISLLGTMITKVLVPYLQSKLKQEDLKTLNFWATVALYAAEQKYKETSKGIDKKQFAIQILKEKIPVLTDEQADVIIEGIGKSLGIFKEE